VSLLHLPSPPSLIAQLMLSAAMPAANSAGGDNKMAQAVTLAALRFAGFFEFNSINPIQGVGSQQLPINVWLNPTYWPFAFRSGLRCQHFGDDRARSICRCRLHHGTLLRRAACAERNRRAALDHRKVQKTLD